MHSTIRNTAAAALALTALAAAQTPQPIVAVGDTLPGAGNVTGIELVRVAGLGQSLVVVTTDHPVHSKVALRDGSVWARVGDPSPFAAQSTAVIADFGNFGFDLFGGLLWNLSTFDPVGSPAELDGLIYEKNSGIVTGSAAYAGSSGFPAGAVLATFEDAHTAEFAQTILRGTIENAAPPLDPRSFLASAEQYGSIGNCCLLYALVVEGDPAAGTSQLVEGIRRARWTTAQSTDGSVVLWSADLDGPTSSDGAVYRMQGGVNTLLAREGTPAPVAGRLWGPLESVSVDANSQGDWTLRARLDASDLGSDEVVLLNGQVFAREGDVHPAIAPAAIASLGAGRVQVMRTHQVVWYAAWNGPGGPAEALLLDDESMVRTGVTTAGGVPIVDLASDVEAFDVSEDGQFVIFRGTPAGGTETAYVLDRGGMQTYCNSKSNSNSCLPFVHWSGESPSVTSGGPFEVRVTNVFGQVPGLFFYSTTGEQSVDYAGGKLCVVPPLVRMPVQTLSGSPPQTGWCNGSFATDFNAWVASGADPALVAGQDVYLQGWYRDPGFTPPNDVGLSKAIAFFLLP